jgi:hypothetical protein
MMQDEDCGVTPAANDNGDGKKAIRLDEAALRIARLIGRQMAREQFELSAPANDNSPHEREHD